jgi:hypothetical protein
VNAIQTEHLSADAIADFAYSSKPAAAEFDRVREHLAEGCRLCAVQVAAFVRGGPWAHDESRHLAGWIVPRRIARPHPTRAGVLADYQLVCGAGEYELDVIVREIESPQRIDIGGQVTRAMALHDPARDVPLTLVEARGSQVVARTRTDGFGEFDFAAACGTRYGLRVGDGGDAPCILVWEGAA